MFRKVPAKRDWKAVLTHVSSRISFSLRSISLAQTQIKILIKIRLGSTNGQIWITISTRYKQTILWYLDIFPDGKVYIIDHLVERTLDEMFFFLEQYAKHEINLPKAYNIIKVSAEIISKPS